MSGQPEQQDKKMSFKTIILFKDQTLGIGSYGAVCKAKCDDLLCAAKIIHPTLFDPTAQHQIAPHREHRLPMRRFQLECEFLSTVRHPNIVQYLGTHQDPDTGLPVLLMELMDDSLTHFLESSPQPIPYHIQVNICHDITLALSFLHSNGILHRDLSSNNVLLIGNMRAKVTDFGMARLDDQNSQVTQLTSTMCPGTDVYMPPEAVQDKPKYTEKIDCFSFGVIAIQIVTQEFPKPGDRQVTINDPWYPQGALKLCVPEIKRRQNDISKLDPNHPLKHVALDCLKDTDVERPSAQHLCERIAALKKDSEYSESVRVVEARSLAEQGRNDNRDRELRQQHSQQIQGLQQIIQSQTSHLEEKDQTISRKEQTIKQNEETIADLRQQVNETQQSEREKGMMIEDKERELRQKMNEIGQLERQLECINQQLVENKQVIAQYQRQIAELEQLIPVTYTSSSSSEEHRDSVKLTWREGKKAPCKTSISYCAAVGRSALYVRVDKEMHGYTISTCSWSRLPGSPTINCPLVVINNLLTLVGGCGRRDALTNHLFSLTGEDSDSRWTEEFPPMPTKRYGSIALCTGTALIIAGGAKDRSILQAVEVLNTETLQWSTAADLPQPLYQAPAAVCGDHIYILGWSNMYTSSVSALIQSCKTNQASTANAWREVAAPPVTLASCVSIHGRLLAVGGKDSNGKPTSVVHMYNPTTDSWEVISHMGIPRWNCIAAVLPNNQLMVVGGYTSGTALTESVEFATVE